MNMYKFDICLSSYLAKLHNCYIINVVDIRPVPDGKLFTLFVRFNIFFLMIENNGSLWSIYLLHVVYNFRYAIVPVNR